MPILVVSSTSQLWSSLRTSFLANFDTCHGGCIASTADILTANSLGSPVYEPMLYPIMYLFPNLLVPSAKLSSFKDGVLANLEENMQS